MLNKQASDLLGGNGSSAARVSPIQHVLQDSASGPLALETGLKA